MALPFSRKVYTGNGESLMYETIDYPDYVSRELKLEDVLKYTSKPRSEDESNLTERIQELERKLAQMDDYVVKTSQKFLELNAKLEKLEKDLDEERQNRLRENRNWGTY